MKLQTLRLHLSEIEIQLLQVEADILENRHSTRTPKLYKERQRRLNNEEKAIQKSICRITYPILTIPVELTSEIFLHCLPDESQLPSLSVASMLLGAICRDWRSIAHGDPLALKIAVWNSRRRTLLVHDWLLRAGSVLFSLSLIRPRGWDRCYCETCFLHPPQGFPEEYCCCLSSSSFTHRWKHLTSFCGDTTSR
ncbi:hypothetical protein DFH09DRAFT_947057 [Mycena vulgaris]|nr:hypothetical protein DFH09DRAFT_947057 [Mycena vulgaris]